MVKTMTVVHPDESSREPFERRFKGLPGFSFVQASFPDIPPVDAFVTAGNGYGIMTAGIDAAVTDHFGPAIMKAVQQRIVNEFRGEQPIGTAFVVETHHDAIPLLIHAPTMRIPGSIIGTDKVYAATWASLLAATHFAAKEIQSVCFPAMGTGFGQISFDESARQMAVAWAHYLDPPAAIEKNWDWVLARHRRISFDGDQQMLRGC